MDGTAPTVLVFGQEELRERLKRGEGLPSHLISIVNPGRAKTAADPSHRMPAEFSTAFEGILKLRFWDDNGVGSLPSGRSRKLASARDAERIVAFLERTRNSASGYVIHCWQGISRSTAVAYGVLYYFLRDEKAAARELIRVRRQAMPLKLILGYFDEIYGSRLTDLAGTIYARRIEAMREELLAMNGEAAELLPLDEGPPSSVT